MAPAYSKDVKSMKRRVALLANRQVGLIQDKVELKAPGRVLSFFVSYADMQISADRQSVTLKQNGESLTVYLLQPEGGALGFDKMPAVALPESKSPETAVYHHQGIEKLVIEAQGVGALEYAILLVPGSMELREKPKFHTLAEWQQASREPYSFKLAAKPIAKPRVQAGEELKLEPSMFTGADLAGTELDAALLLDNNPYTHWHAQAESKDHSTFKPAELTVDLGKVQLLSGISTQWVTAYQRAYRFRVLTSVDGQNWDQQFWGVNRLHDPLQRLDFEMPAKARYVKLMLTGDLRAHSKLSELRVIGE